MYDYFNYLNSYTTGGGTLKNKGLEDVVAAETKISSIINDKLEYQGYDINELVESTSFEEVTYLLWNGKLPNAQELDDFCSKIQSNYSLPDEVINFIKNTNHKKVNPMEVLRTSVSMLNENEAVSMLSKVAMLVISIARVRTGNELLVPKQDFGIAENFIYMINGREPTQEEVRTIDKVLVLHAEHELNASTFSARVCASTMADLTSCITAAISTLKGPLHGGANEAVMKMLTEIERLEFAEQYVKGKLARKEKIMGFGHRVYKNNDPRELILKIMSKEQCIKSNCLNLHEIAERVEEVAFKEKKILPNVDFYSAPLYNALGIESALFTPIFVASRVSGWIAHVIEQQSNNRIFRPRAEYIGVSSRKVMPAYKR